MLEPKIDPLYTSGPWSARLLAGGHLQWWRTGDAPSNSRTRRGVFGFAFGEQSGALVAVDAAGVSIIDPATGDEVIRRERLSARSGAVAFAMQDRVVVYSLPERRLEAWEWGADIVLTQLETAAEVLDLEVGDTPQISVRTADGVTEHWDLDGGTYELVPL